jgi:serine-type D-Ala-D-Ala carboxypeptidase/endopeptidase (penicillin-binding protein 4)
MRASPLLRSGALTASLLLFRCATAPAPSTPTPARAPATILPAFDIDHLTAESPFDHAVWGIRVEEDDGTVVVDRNGSELLMPASNRKLFTAAVALDCLGANSRIATELWTSAPLTAGRRLDGSLVVKGDGDPSFGGRFYEYKLSVFAPFLRALRDRGIEEIGGDIIADVSRYDRDTLPGGWKLGEVGADYAAPVDALAFNENLIGVDLDDPDCGAPRAAAHPEFVPITANVLCGPVGEPIARSTPDNRVVVEGTVKPADAKHWGDIIAVSDPALFTAQALRAYLIENGIRVDGRARTSADPRQWGEKIGEIDSPFLFQIASRLLKNSQNLYAEMLFKKVSPPEAPASYQGAREVERRFLTQEVGIDGREFSFSDGCGLTTDDLVTPRAIVRVVRYLNTPARRALTWAILATPAEDGTLRKRLTELSGRLRGKTGSIRGVNALGGIIRSVDGARYRYFSIIVNHHDGDGDGDAALRIIDTIVREYAKF